MDEDDDWRDASVLGSQLEVEISYRGKTRWRPMTLARMQSRRIFGDESYPDLPWVYGDRPTDENGALRRYSIRYTAPPV